MLENVIDTHIHIWNFDQAEYPWLKGDNSILNRNYELEELDGQRIKAGITAGMLVQAANNLPDTDHMLRVAAVSDWIVGVVGWLPLEDPAVTDRILDQEYTAGGRLKGVRHLIHNEADPAWLLQAPVLESLGLLAARDLPYDVVGIVPGHLRTALKVAEKWPELRLVLDHLNQPPIADTREGREWEELMKAAARHENIFVKISGLGTASGKGQDWKPEDLEPCIEFALYHFGAERCFCGGDWPVCLLAGSYERTWTAYRSIIKKYLGIEDQERVLCGNAERFYRLSKGSPS